MFDPSKITEYPMWVRALGVVWIAFTCFMATTPLWVKKVVTDPAHFRIQEAGIFTYKTGGQVNRLANFGFKNSGKNTARVIPFSFQDER